MIRILCLFSVLLIRQEVPYKPTDAFEIKFDLSFKQRSTEDTSNSTIHLSETVGEQEKRSSIGPLPYLILNVKILKMHPDEVRIRALRDNDIPVFNKKAAEGMEFKIDVGFLADIKGVKEYRQVIEFLSVDKTPLSRIVIELDKEGNYLVNGEKRGKI